MSSSSSDSDSDDYEPIRKIKINIRPKGEVSRAVAADVNEIKASVEAWRPLGPPTHPSLSRRQNSMSSVSSMSFGASGSIHGLSQPNPSVNHNNNIISGTNNDGNNTAIDSGLSQSNNKSSSGFGSDSLHSSPSCSSLVGDFYARPPPLPPLNPVSVASAAVPARTNSPLTLINHGDSVPIAIAIQESIELTIKAPYDTAAIEPKYDTRSLGNIKIAFPNAFAARCSTGGKPSAILKLHMHSTANISRYHASRLIKDLDLESDNDTTMTSQNNGSLVRPNGTAAASSFADLIDIPVMVQEKREASNSKMIEFEMETLSNQLRRMYEQSPRSRYFNLDIIRYQIKPIESIEEAPLQVCAYWKVEAATVVKLRIDFRRPSRCGFSQKQLRELAFTVSLANLIPTGTNVTLTSPGDVGLNGDFNILSGMNLAPEPPLPVLTHKPEASWNCITKHLTWKFDSLSACATNPDGSISLFAKLDFRNCPSIAGGLQPDCKLPAVDAKFLVADSTLSKATMSIEANGYRMSMLKEELRSGRYKCEPFVVA